MKTKHIFSIFLILVLALSITAVVAQDAKVGDLKFTVPDEYHVLETKSDSVNLVKDDNHAIVVQVYDTLADADTIKSTLESKGYKLIGQRTYNADGYDVLQQNYEYGKFTCYTYMIDVNNKPVAMIFTIPTNETVPENEANPVTTILDTIG